MATNEEKEQRIRERAYQIWLDEGQPHGHDKEHWHRAETQINAEVHGQTSQSANPSQNEQANGGVQPPLAGPYENIS